MEEIFYSHRKSLIAVTCCKIYFSSNGDPIHVDFYERAFLAVKRRVRIGFTVLWLRGLFG
jgi:hypothetical protein